MKLQKHSPALGPLGRLTLQEGTKRPQVGGSPEGTKRLQAGGGAKRNPCLDEQTNNNSPALGPQGRLTLQERAAEGSVTPSGFMCNARGSRGFTPACSLFRPSALRVGYFK